MTWIFLEYNLREYAYDYLLISINIMKYSQLKTTTKFIYYYNKSKYRGVLLSFFDHELGVLIISMIA